MKTFRIFIASPGDVAEERRLAREVVDQLRHERMFRDDLNLQVIAWDQPGMGVAMKMGMTPQDAIREGILLPSQCDLVLMILWSRMGTPLPPSYTKPDGSRYLSGTEWEYYDALKAFEEKKHPNIWMYRRDKEPSIKLGDPDREEKHRQFELLQQFYGQALNSDGSINHGMNFYNDPGHFRLDLIDRLRDHLYKGLSSYKNLKPKFEAEQELAVTNNHRITNTNTSALKQKLITEEKQKSTPQIAEQETVETVQASKVEHYFPHAKDSGEDRYGYWICFEFNGALQIFRWIKPGAFTMGSPWNEDGRQDDESLHKVTLTKGFWLADTTVNQVLWQAVMGKSGCNFQGKNLPVDSVSFNLAIKFIKRLNQFCEGVKFRLPTEAEWEYSCRSGLTTPFNTGINITTEQANYDGDGLHDKNVKGIYRRTTVSVSRFERNSWGLYQMHGNVWEWCSDFYGKYPKRSIVNPKGPKKGKLRVTRGGSWFDGKSKVRSAGRRGLDPSVNYFTLGFRLVVKKFEH